MSNENMAALVAARLWNSKIDLNHQNAWLEIDRN